MWDTGIEQVFARRIVITAVIVGIVIAGLLFVRWALKADPHFKRIFAVWIAISALVVAVLGVDLSKIVLDIQKKGLCNLSRRVRRARRGTKELENRCRI